MTVNSSIQHITDANEGALSISEGYDLPNLLQPLIADK